MNERPTNPDHIRDPHVDKQVVRPYGVVEMVRTGLVAMARGTGAAVQRPAEAVPAGHDNLGDYSV